VALAWKLAEVAVIADIAGNRPVLLLDDVMSELDEGRRHSLAGFVGSAAQTIVTTTNLGYFEEALLERAKVVVLS
jgi:DNA replication and repair protein RecF